MVGCIFVADAADDDDAVVVDLTGMSVSAMVIFHVWSSPLLCVFIVRGSDCAAIADDVAVVAVLEASLVLAAGKSPNNPPYIFGSSRCCLRECDLMWIQLLPIVAER